MKRAALSVTFIFCTIYLSLGQEIHMSKKYELLKLGNDINTRHDDAAPVISPDGNTLYFFISNHPENNYGSEGSQDIWVSRKGENDVGCCRTPWRNFKCQSGKSSIFGIEWG